MQRKQVILTAITVNMMMKTNHRITLGLLCILMFMPLSVKAQFSMDVTSIEAYINDHKEQRSLLLVRSTLEASNKLLHDYSSKANTDYRVMGVVN